MVALRRLLYLAAWTVAALLLTLPLAAQEPPLGGRAGATRAELESTLAAARAGDNRISQDQMEAIESRLTKGDFSVGDQVGLAVSGEPTLTGNFPITGLPEDPTLKLPDIPDIPLRGVLRSELQEYLSDQLGRYLRNPDIQTQSLMRVAVFGEVGNPGFYHLDPHITVADAIMQAGGPTSNADTRKTVVRRSGETIYNKVEIATAITEGTTLDRLNLRGGDTIDIGGKSSFGKTLLSGIIYIGAVATAIFAIQRLL